MNINKNLLAGSALCVGGFLPLSAASLDDVAEYIDLDGQAVAFADFTGDAQEIGASLTDIYNTYLQSAPNAMPIPLQFEALFSTLGIDTVEAVAFSSKEMDNGLMLNRSFTRLMGERVGLTALYDLGNRPFTAAQMAPDTATMVMSGQMNFDELRDTIVNLVVQVMGPMGQGLAQQELMNVLPGTDLTVTELFDELSVPMDFILQQELKETGEPEIQAWMRLQGSGAVLDRLLHMVAMFGIEAETTEMGVKVDFSPLMQDSPVGLILTNTPDGDLILYTSEEYNALVMSSEDKLVDTEAFKKLTAGLPKEAAFYSYNKGTDIAPLLEALGQEPEVAAYVPVIEKAVAFLVGDFMDPSASAVFAVDGGIAQMSYASFSYKQLAVALPTAFFGGLTAAMAIPAFQKVRTNSQEKAVTNNLRQLASAADQYMLEYGVTEVTYEDLGEYFADGALSPVCGEDYSGMVISQDMGELGITLPDGRYISIDF